MANEDALVVTIASWSMRRRRDDDKLRLCYAFGEGQRPNAKRVLELRSRST